MISELCFDGFFYEAFDGNLKLNLKEFLKKAFLFEFFTRDCYVPDQTDKIKRIKNPPKN